MTYNYIEEETTISFIPESNSRTEAFNLLYEYGFEDLLLILSWLKNRHKGLKDSTFFCGVTSQLSECGFLTEKQKVAAIKTVLNLRGVKYILTNREVKDFLLTIDTGIEFEFKEPGYMMKKYLTDFGWDTVVDDVDVVDDESEDPFSDNMPF
jgi:hypothetical protein